ncbi:CoA transferase [Marivirga sp. S37H4]|uniref:CoA transferase n=1 Tax=Marivirga aurantiaca TaxID=2802615 RepID=A0A934X294_9BACT|nr:CaiB/BaiF CoA-transferase family protein [Marivirga aurantiaca]MBK6266971.1 CoA transferase [Marivirga aurantiaca]
MNQIFEDIRVLELANVLAGPSVGQFFAELGAEVIKIENPGTGGDVTRTWKLSSESSETDVSAYFSAVNSGKKSIALNLKNKDHYETFMDLVKISDIIIASYKPGDAEKLGLDAKTLHEINPSLIYGLITGYGEDIPKVGYDAILQAESGFMWMNGEPGGKSLKMPVALIDILAAHQLKEAVLLAIIQRLKNGKGAKVAVSLFDTAISSLANQATNFLVAGKNPQKMGAEHPNIAPYGSVFECNDKKQIVIAVGTDKQFQSLCKTLNINDLPIQSDFSTNSARVKNRDRLNHLLQKAFDQFESNEILSRLEQYKIPAGKLQSVEDVFNSGTANHLLIQSELKTVGLRNFVAKSDFLKNSSHISPPPFLNQHANLVFGKLLGYSERRIQDLTFE